MPSLLLACLAGAHAAGAEPTASKRIRAIPGLVGFWDFSEPAGSERISRGTSRAHALAEAGGPIARADEGPISGHSAYLDGSQYFVIPHDRTGNLNIHGTNAQISMVAFVKLERMSETIAGMWSEGSGAGDDSGVRQYALLLDMPTYGGDDQVVPHISATGGYSRDTAADGTEYTLPWCGDYAASASKVALNQWVSVGFTYDGTWIKAYYNGVFEPRPGHPENPALDRRDHDYYTKTGPGGGYRGVNPYYQPDGIYTFDPDDPVKRDEGAPFAVGARQAVGNEAHGTFKGRIGGLAVFDRALSEAEMRAIHDAALAESLVDRGRSAPRSSASPDERSLLDAGDGERLAAVFAKARRGEAITVGVIGGSITQAGGYGKRVVQWLRETFPDTTVTFVNAGIGATGSAYGALRIQRDLLSHDPDLVIVEYAVNDPDSRASAVTLEGLLRQAMKHANRPAVILLFMMHSNGTSAQEWFSRVGSHYALPMVSYRDALWPEIAAGRMAWREISPDTVHPNNRGHALAAGWIIRFLRSRLDERAPQAVSTTSPALPAPLLTDAFEFTELQEAPLLKPTANNGWTYDGRRHWWTSDQPGAWIEFQISGRVLLASHYVIRGAMGRARVTVDGEHPVTLDGWFDGTWGGYRKTGVIADNLAPGTHTIRFLLLSDKNEGSTGHGFRILGLGAAGTGKACTGRLE